MQGNMNRQSGGKNDESINLSGRGEGVVNLARLLSPPSVKIGGKNQEDLGNNLLGFKGLNSFISWWFTDHSKIIHARGGWKVDPIVRIS